MIVPPPLLAVAVWKKLLKEVTVEVSPLFKIVALYVWATPAVAEAGEGATETIKFGPVVA